MQNHKTCTRYEGVEQFLRSQSAPVALKIGSNRALNRIIDLGSIRYLFESLLERSQTLSASIWEASGARHAALPMDPGEDQEGEGGNRVVFGPGGNH